MSSFSPINQASPEIQMTGIRKNLKSSFDSLLENKSDTMKVYCRVRPMLQSEEDSGYTECIAAIDDQVVRAVVPSSSVKFKNNSHNGQEIIEDFKYTLSFGPEVGQFSFFQETILDIMQGFIEGQNGLIFSYGITNSGKTYTLQGDEANPGIIPLALHLFFASTEHQLLDEVSVKPDKYSEIVVLNHNERAREQQLKEQLLQISEHESGNKSADSTATKSFGMTLCDAFYDNFKFEDRQTTLPPEEMVASQSAFYMKDLGKKSADEQAGLCSVWISFIEIYNEYIYDLLQPNVLKRQKLNLAEDQNGEVYVKGAREICVSNSEEAIKLLNLGRRNLRIASTKLNYQSSRSHCIYTLKVIRLYDEENSSCGRVNRISFCDLAGSERADKSQTTGLRLKEAGYINTSLLVLGRCLDQLRLNQNLRDKKMIPFRESKLTRLFYSHFLGKGKATMIANASPCEQTFDETLNVLRFSALAKELTLNDSYISMASNSIQNLTTQWGQTRARSIADAPLDQSSDFNNSLSFEIQEKDDIIEKLLNLADNLRDNLKKEKKEKAELEIAIRQDVCNEYSEFSDKLIENQRKISEQRIEGVKKNFQKRLDNMEKMYEDKIKELTLQLEEYEVCSEESINESVDKGNETSMSRIVQETKYIPSPQINLFDEKHDDDSQDVDEFEKLECTSPEHEKLISENKSLKLDLSSLKNELDSTTEQLQKYTVMIVDLQNEIKQYEEKSTIKTDSMDMKNIKVEQTEAETFELKSLTEELQVAKEKLEQSSVLLKQSQTKEIVAKENCDVLKCKLEEANQVLEEYKKEFDEIKLDSINKEREQLALMKEKQDLEENISSLSEKLALVVSDAEQLKEAKLQAEDKYSQQSIEILKSKAIPEEQYNELCSKNNELTQVFEEQQLKLETATEALKEQELKFSKLESEYATFKVDYDKLLEEHLSVVESFNNLKEEIEKTVPAGKYEELVCNIAELSQALKEQELKLANATEALKEQKSKFNELELECIASKNENAKLLEDYSCMKEKLNISLKELDESTKFSDHLKSQMEHLENQCLETRTESAEISENYKNLEKTLDSVNEKLDALNAEYEQLKREKIGLENSHATSISELQTTLECAKKEVEELKETLQACRDENIELKKDLKNLENKLESQAEEEDALNAEYEQLKREKIGFENSHSTSISELQTTLECAKKEVEELKGTLQACRDENIELKKDLKNLENKLESQAEEEDALNAEYEQLKREKIGFENSHSTSISELQTTLECAKKEVEELKGTLQACRDENIELKKDLKNLENKLESQAEEEDALNAEYEQLKREKIGFENSHSTSISELQTTLECAKKEVEELKGTLQACRDENIELKKDLKNLENKLESQAEEEDALNAEYEQLKREKIGLENSHATSISELQTTLECAKKEVEELKETLQVCRDENIELKKDLKNLENILQSQAEEEEKTVAEQLNIELKTKLEDATQSIVSQDLKIDELEAECSELNSQLKNSTQTLNEQKATFDALTAKCASHESEITCLSEKYSTLEKDFNKIKTESDAANIELQTKLEESTQIVESQKLKIDELENKCNDFCTEVEITTDSLRDQKSKMEELSIEATAYQDDKIKMMEKYTALEIEFRTATAELDESTKFSDHLKSQMEHLENQCLETRTESAKISENYKNLEKTLDSVNEKLDALNAEYEQLKREKIGLENSHATSISELQTTLECAKKEVEELKETLQACRDENIELKKDLKNLENKLESQAEEEALECAKKEVEELKETLQVCRDENIELKSDLKNLENKLESQAEAEDNLLNVLGKCELSSSNKIKILRSSSIKNLEEILDLKRQVKEKEASIEQLEKAIRDAQKVKKENEAKLEKQITALKHQHSIEIEEIIHLKRISEQENVKLKSALAQIENQKEETPDLIENQKEETPDLKEDKENSLKSKTNKGNKKKGSSSKEENDDSENNDAPKQRRACRTKEKKDSEDSSIVPKRRRPLRSKQAKVSEDIEEVKDEESFEDGQKPTRGTRKRKSAEQEWKPSTKRTTKKKLAENSENMSPVQKAISYVGAKFRSVAQSVSNVPSPRVTRGRKKLFNVDEGSSSAVPKWKL